MLEQLQQLTTATWDGDLISKQDRTRLVKRGYAKEVEGWNLLTPKGLRVLLDMGLLKPPVRPGEETDDEEDPVEATDETAGPPDDGQDDYRNPQGFSCNEIM